MAGKEVAEGEEAKGEAEGRKADEGQPQGHAAGTVDAASVSSPPSSLLAPAVADACTGPPVASPPQPQRALLPRDGGSPLSGPQQGPASPQRGVASPPAPPSSTFSLPCTCPAAAQRGRSTIKELFENLLQWVFESVRAWHGKR